jgi:hypothetical protein
VSWSCWRAPEDAEPVSGGRGALEAGWRTCAGGRESVRCGETGFLEYGLEVACVEVAAVDGRVEVRSKDQSVVLPEPVDPFALIELSLPGRLSASTALAVSLTVLRPLAVLGEVKSPLYKIRVT